MRRKGAAAPAADDGWNFPPVIDTFPPHMTAEEKASYGLILRAKEQTKNFLELSDDIASYWRFLRTDARWSLSGLALFAGDAVGIAKAALKFFEMFNRAGGGRA